MQAQVDRRRIRRRIRHRIRRNVTGTAARPRLAIYRSQRHIYALAIDDATGRTVAAASTLDGDVRPRASKGWNIEAAKAVGGAIADRLKKAGVAKVVLDRGGFLYHGRVKALADAAREGGLEF
jgi:large subunit ribosomal protein L18